jgi:hypothetical protein
MSKTDAVSDDPFKRLKHIFNYAKVLENRLRALGWSEADLKRAYEQAEPKNEEYADFKRAYEKAELSARRRRK